MASAFPLTFDHTFEANPNWLLDGEALPRQIDEQVTAESVSLTWRVETDILTSRLRPLKSDEGQVATLATDDGGFRALDRANGGNTFTLTPPDKRPPLRQERAYHVRKYEEEMVSQTNDEWTVEVEFVPAATRTDTNTIDNPNTGAAFDLTFDTTFERRNATAWEFTTPNGTFTSDRVSAEFVGTGESGVERFEITARLTYEQAHAFETAYARLRGGRIREIPDAPNVAVDDSAGDSTITLDSPTGATLPDGEYIVLDWSSTRISGAYQTVEFEVARA